MATLARFQAFALDDQGNVLTLPTVDVIDENTSTHAALFSDRAGATPIANPFTGLADGSFGFHVAGGVYKITVTKAAVNRISRYVGISTGSEHDTNYLDGANNVVPAVDNTQTLGTTSLKWADIFLGSGAVINWNNGDVLLTHSTDLLTLTGGNLSITVNATLSVSGALTVTSGAITGRHDPRVSSAASGDISPDISVADMYIRTALAATTNINAPIGTPVQGDRLTFRFKDSGVARTLTWNAIYRAIGVTIPTLTTISKTLYVGCIYNSTDTKWDVLAVNLEP